MKITRRQLRRIIRETVGDQLPYKSGQPWTDPKAPVGVDRTEDDLDRELTDEEIEASMGMERADPSGDSEFFLGYGDALDGKGLPVDASPDYKAGWEDGSLDRVTESIIRESPRKTKKLPPTDTTIRMHMSQFRVSDDPYEVAVEIGEEYGWSQKQIEKAEKLIRRKYIR